MSVLEFRYSNPSTRPVCLWHVTCYLVIIAFNSVLSSGRLFPYSLDNYFTMLFSCSSRTAPKQMWQDDLKLSVCGGEETNIPWTIYEPGISMKCPVWYKFPQWGSEPLPVTCYDCHYVSLLVHGHRNLKLSLKLQPNCWNARNFIICYVCPSRQTANKSS